MKPINTAVKIVVGILALPWLWVVAEKVLSSKVIGLWTQYAGWVDKVVR